MQVKENKDVIDFSGMSLMQRLALDTPQTTKIYTAIQKKITEAQKRINDGAAPNKELNKELPKIEAKRYFTCIADDVRRIGVSVLHTKEVAKEKIKRDSDANKSYLGLRKVCHYAQASFTAPCLMVLFTVKSIGDLFCLHRLFMPFLNKSSACKDFFEIQTALKEKKISPLVYLFNETLCLNIMKKRGLKKNRNLEKDGEVEIQKQKEIVEKRFKFFKLLSNVDNTDEEKKSYFDQFKNQQPNQLMLSPATINLIKEEFAKKFDFIPDENAKIKIEEKEVDLNDIFIEQIALLSHRFVETMERLAYQPQGDTDAEKKRALLEETLNVHLKNGNFYTNVDINSIKERLERIKKDKPEADLRAAATILMTNIWSKNEENLAFMRLTRINHMNHFDHILDGLYLSGAGLVKSATPDLSVYFSDKDASFCKNFNLIISANTPEVNKNIFPQFKREKTQIVNLQSNDAASLDNNKTTIAHLNMADPSFLKTAPISEKNVKYETGTIVKHKFILEKQKSELDKFIKNFNNQKESIQKAVELIEKAQNDKKTILVHCALGQVRSAFLVTCALMRRTGLEANEIATFLGTQRAFLDSNHPINETLFVGDNATPDQQTLKEEILKTIKDARINSGRSTDILLNGPIFVYDNIKGEEKKGFYQEPDGEPKESIKYILNLNDFSIT